MATGPSIEICVESARGAEAARQGGADRVELCTALELGGLTPSRGAVERLGEVAGVRRIVLLRPRAGDFCYDAEDRAVMLCDLDHLRESGANGVAVGALRSDGTLDAALLERVAERAGQLELVCHRAFDLCRDPLAALEELCGLGFHGVLSSGQAPTALEGTALLARLVDAAADRIEVRAAGKLRPENAARVLAETGCRALHAAAGARRVGPYHAHAGAPRLGSASDESAWNETDPQLVRALVEAARGKRGS
ncbi:MAG: copper homeostasis protein CutC [Planctomycetes bacterium]|nr:copper homeostasis protein CutC [Planctomycetota bacterium]MCB9903847.1 copper homeostasis protein CutC [Planctomycetota bacterium]